MFNKNYVKLDNFGNGITIRKKTNSTSGMYLTTVKVAQYRMAYKNIRAKEEPKQETSKKKASQKVCLQKKCSEHFHQCQAYMDNILYLSEETIHTTLIYLSYKTLMKYFYISEVIWATPPFPHTKNKDNSRN